MASTAISAQGSVVYIGSGSGSAKTITSLVAGFPTIFTSAAHGFVNGDVVTLAGIGGADAALLNGQVGVVNNKTANTFAIDIDTTGKAVASTTGTATPVTWTKIANIKTFSTPEGQSTEIDVSNLDSTAKEFIMGLRDSGTISLNGDFGSADAGQVAVRAAHVANPQPLKPFKMVLPDATAFSFSAFVKKAPLSIDTDKQITTSIDLRISGSFTIA